MQLVRKRQQVYITHKVATSNTSAGMDVEIVDVKDDTVKVSLLDPAYDSDYFSDDCELGRLNEYCANNYVVYDGAWHILPIKVAKYLRMLKEKNIHLADVVYISKRDKYESMWQFTR